LTSATAVFAKSRDAVTSKYARWALVLAAAAAPAYAVRWRMGPLPTTLLESLILLTLALYLVAQRRAREPVLLRTPYDRPILLLLVAGALAVGVAPDHWAALGLYRAYFLEPIAVYYVAVALLRAPEHRRWLLAALGIAGTVVSVANLALFVAHPQSVRIAVAEVPVAIYNSPNFVAMFLEPLLALAAAFVLFGIRASDRRLAGSFLVLAGSAVLLTFSRGGYLALAVLAIAVVLSLRRRVPIVVAGGAVILFLLWRFPEVPGRVGHLLNAKDPTSSSVVHRLTLWRATLRILREHPLFGTGIVPTYPHNLWLALWSELGLLGLLAFMLLFVGLVWRSGRGVAVASAAERPLLWGIFVGLLMIGAHGLVDTPYWKNDLSLEFWLLAGLLVAATGVNRVVTTRPPP
jgi:putative inorganic carbon (HCO3(-)) transporter